MDASLICMMAGPVIAGAVSAVKRIPFVAKYPKTISFIISTIGGAVTAFTGGAAGVGVMELAQCILIPFAGAVATYESVIKQAAKVIGPEAGPGSGNYEEDRV